MEYLRLDLIMETLRYICIQISPLRFASLRSEELVIRKSARDNFLFWLSWKWWNTHAYQVSLPCIAWFLSLRSEKIVMGKVPEAIFCWWSSLKCWNTYAYQVSFPCIAWFSSLRSEEVVIGKKRLRPFLFMVVMETLKYTCIPSFTSMHCTVCKFEKCYRKKCLRQFFVKWLSWKCSNTHAYQVSLQCIPWCASLRNEKVAAGKTAWCNFLSMVIMEMLKYTCVRSFTYMHYMVCKFEKWRSSYREKCLRAFFVDGCHGNNEIHMRTKFHFHVHLVGKFEKWRSDFKENCLRLFVVGGCECHGGDVVSVCTEFHFNICYD